MTTPVRKTVGRRTWLHMTHAGRVVAVLPESVLAVVDAGDGVHSEMLVGVHQIRVAHRPDEVLESLGWVL